MPNYLWAINTAKDAAAGNTSITDSVQPPSLVAASNASNIGNLQRSGILNNGKTVNVVSDFYWTYSKLIQSRQEVPRIILTEKRLKVNSLVAQLAYSIGAATEISTQTLNQLGVSKDTQKRLIDFIGDLAIKAGSAAGDIANKTAAQFGPDGQAIYNRTMQAVRDSIKRVQQTVYDDNAVVNSSPWLKPYKNLYITENTGWSYILPYFENYANAAQNSYGDSSNYSIFTSELLGKASNIAGGFAEALSLLNTNIKANFAFQEKAKFYNFPTDGEEITVTFPLINTGSATFDDVIKNWQFLFLLLYQNKPGRISKTIVEPPVLYQLEIPGQKFIPYAYITGMAVDFVGSRREMNFDIPTTLQLNTNVSVPYNPNLPQANNAIPGAASSVVGSQSMQITPLNVTAIIPDAYQVRLTIKGLTSETKNFMYQAIGEKSKVTVSTLINQNIGTAADQLLKATASNRSSSVLPAPDNIPVTTPINSGNSQSDQTIINTAGANRVLG
jgi:hypothetical protein